MLLYNREVSSQLIRAHLQNVKDFERQAPPSLKLWRAKWFTTRHTKSQRAKRIAQSGQIKFPSFKSKRFALCAMHYAYFLAENAAQRKKGHFRMGINQKSLNTSPYERCQDIWDLRNRIDQRISPLSE
jgi:hypothetical protein